nr:unnamed protein product [Spirometra erinaceieuropaei]
MTVRWCLTVRQLQLHYGDKHRRLPEVFCQSVCHLSFNWPAGMQRAVAGLMEKEERPTGLESDGDPSIKLNPNAAMIKSKLTSEDDLQSDGWIPVSLLCPLALTRIEIPVRSVNCDHLQCFDLSSYLTINKRRPRWSCPVCSSPAPFRDLRRDDFFVQLMADQSLKDAQMVHVDASGHWRETSRPTESDPSATVASMGLIPGISTDNSTTAAVPSLLNGTSRMSPCTLESNLSSEPVAPIDPDATQSSDCVVLIDDDDDEDQANDATQPGQPTFAHPTSFNDCCALFPPAAVTDEQPAELPSEALDSGPTNLFVDLAASSDEEPDVTMASTPPLSSPQPSAAPTPSSISPTTTESCSLPAVIPSPSLARLPVGIAPRLPVASQPLNLTSHATQPPPPPPGVDAAVVNAAGTSSTPQASPPPNKPNKATGLAVQADLKASPPRHDLPTAADEIMQEINSSKLDINLTTSTFLTLASAANTLPTAAHSVASPSPSSTLSQPRHRPQRPPPPPPPHAPPKQPHSLPPPVGNQCLEYQPTLAAFASTALTASAHSLTEWAY